MIEPTRRRPQRVRHALARLIVWSSSRLVSRSARTDWLREWNAELWHEEDRAGRERHEGRALLRAALGAPRDALATWRGSVRRGAGAGSRGGAGEPVSLLLHDGRRALRALTRNPAFAGISVLTLALGLAANTALFTVVDAVLLRPLPYVQPERLVVLQHQGDGLGGAEGWPLSEHGFYFLRENSRVFEEVGVWLDPGRVGGEVVVGDDRGLPERTAAATASASLLRVLGARPALGRVLVDADNAPDAAPVVVLGHDFWRRRFGADPGVIGGTLRVEGFEREIVGVVEAGLHLPDRRVNLWLPVRLDRASTPMNSHYLRAVARLRADTELAAARADATALTARFAEALPSAYSRGFLEGTGFRTEVLPLRDAVVGDVARSLWVVFGAVALVLLIACANVANLFLVRAEGRRREVAVRAALGASRRALARFFLAESLVVAVAASALALLLARAGVPLLLSLAPADLQRLADIAPRATTWLFTAVLALAAGIVFGLFPLLRVGVGVTPQSLTEGTARLTSGRGHNAARAVLVVAQMALALVLLASAGLLLRTFDGLRSVEPGFRPERALAFEVVLPFGAYPDQAPVTAFHTRLVDALAALPGVQAAGGASALPLKDRFSCFGVHSAEPRAGAADEPPCFGLVWATQGWFEAMGLAVDGRAFERRDNDERRGPALVSRALAERLWPGEDPIGRRISPFHDDAPHFEVVGVVADVRERGLHEPPAQVVYYPLEPVAGDRASWIPQRAMTYVVRTSLDRPESLLPEIRRVVSEVDAGVPVGNARTLEAVVARSLGRVSFVMLLLGVAAGIALLLAAVGLYGVVAYVVGQRGAEIGIRMALGARVSQVGAMVLRQSLALAGTGVVVGLVGALAATRVLGSLLFGVSPADPPTLAAVSVGLLAVAALAAWVPARRAARVDPAQTLRAG